MIWPHDPYKKPSLVSPSKLTLPKKDQSLLILLHKLMIIPKLSLLGPGKMTKTPSYSIENPDLEHYKPKNYCPRKGISLLPIIFLVLTYILFFYIFNVSPSSIFNNTKMLFFISNTLILIIAADYGAFTDKEKHDLYHEYAMMRSQSRNSDPVLVSGYPEKLRRVNSNYLIPAEEINNPAEEVTEKEIVCVQTCEEIPEKILQVVGENKPENATAEKSEPVENINGTDDHKEACDARNRVNPKPYHRSKSHTVARAKSIAESSEIEPKRKDTVEKSYERSKSENSKWMIVREPEKETEKWENVLDESEEFAKMSNEELNRRVEEFIQRFNRQMRLQAPRNRQILSS